jgi:alpha-ketoglutarate-dependent taurine dioxygenase
MCVCDDTGGATRLLDGFRVAQALYAEDAAAFACLRRTPVTYRCIDQGYHLEATHPVFVFDPARTDTLVQVRYNDYDRTPCQNDFLASSEYSDFYHAWLTMSKLTRDERFIWKLRLAPGDMLIVDNRRVCA